MGPTECTSDRAHAEGPVHASASGARLRFQPGEKQGCQFLRVSRLQETETYRSNLHLPTTSQDQQDSGPLDPAWSRLAV